MKIKLNCILAELSKGFKPGMDHTSKTLELAQFITCRIKAQQIIESVPINIDSGLTMEEMKRINKNINMTLLSITRVNFIQ